MLHEMSEMSEASDAMERVCAPELRDWSNERLMELREQRAALLALATHQPYHEQAVELLGEEIEEWEGIVAHYNAAKPAPPAPFVAVVIAQEQTGGRWWATWRYDAARFRSSRYAELWARMRLASLRARSFAPVEREGARRLCAEVWDVSRDGAPILVSEHTK